MPESIIGPTSHYFFSQRLKLHYVDWGNHDAPLMILVHGGRDHCRNWDWTALELRKNFHVIAPDLRGHGDSAHAVGSPYAMIDYVVDLAQLINALGNKPLTLIGHSLGGGIVLQYTGVFPKMVKKVVSIEGLGPPPAMIKDTPASERMKNWVREMQSLAQRKVREYASIEEALSRMRSENPHLKRRAGAPSDDPRHRAQRERHLFVEVRQLRSRDHAVSVQSEGCRGNLVAHRMPDAADSRRRVVDRRLGKGRPHQGFQKCRDRHHRKSRPLGPS